MISIVLQNPIKVRRLMSQHVIDKIELRSVTVKDIFGLDFAGPASTESMIQLISRLSGIRAEELGNLSLPDFNSINFELSKTMMPRGQK